MNNNFIKLLNDKGDIKVYKYMEIPDSDPLHEPISYYEEYIYNVFNLLKENKKLQEEKDHYKHLYSEVKKQKDDVVEFIKKNKKVITKYEAKDTGLPIGTFMWNIDEVLRMLGEIDVED